MFVSRRSLTFEAFQQTISRAKIILVEIASFVALAVILFHALRVEMKW